MLFREAIEKLTNTYNSIDFRIATIKHNAIWKSCYTIIRFSKQTVDELKDHYTQLHEDVGFVITTEYKQILHAFPISELQNIISNWTNKRIVIPNNKKIHLLNLNEFNQQANNPTSPDDDQILNEWNCFVMSNNAKLPGLQQKLINFNDIARKQTFDDYRDHLCNLFEVNQRYVGYEGTNTIIAPIFLKIENISFKNKSIIINCKGDNRNIDFYVAIYKGRKYSEQHGTLKKKFTIYSKGSIQNHISDYPISQKLPIELSGDDHYKVTSMYNDMLIDSKSGIVRYATEKFPNSLLDVFNQFITPEKFRKMIFQYKQESGKEKLQDVFERVVSWILSFLNFNSIWLGKDNETIGVEPNNISVDVLAKIEKTIIISSVKTAIPKEHEFTKMKEYRENLGKMINDPDIELKSVVFCRHSLVGLEEVAQRTGVRLIGKDELMEILSHIEKGDIDQARQVLTRPYNFRDGLI